MGDLHILRVSGKYLAQTRGRGCRKWQSIGQATPLAAAAAQTMTAALYHLNHHRGRVLLVPDNGYYEPSVHLEAKRA